MACEPCTLAHLAEVLEHAQGEIVAEWRRLAARLPHARKLERPLLAEQVPDLVAEIARELAPGRERRASTEPDPGTTRLPPGADAGDLVAECHLLRLAFLTIAERHELGLAEPAARIVHGRIDEGLQQAMKALAARQALLAQVQADEQLAVFAHELRTPLNALGLAVQELRETLGPSAPTGASELLEIVTRNLHRATELIRQGEDKVLRPEIAT